MKIAIVINASWNIYNFRMGLIEAFMEARHEVYTIAPPDEYSDRLVAAGCHYVPVALDNKGSHPLKDLQFTYKLHHLYRQIQPDVVLHYTIKPNIYGTMAAALLGIPVINNVSGLGTVFLRDNLTSKIAHVLYKLTFWSPKKIFFQNPDDRDLFIQKKLVKQPITDLLPGSGINLSLFKPEPFKRNATFSFLLIGRLLYDKGIVEYIEAIKLLKQKGIRATFYLLGFKDYSAAGIPETLLKEWLDNGWVTYLGTTDDVRIFIKEADCVVLPSYREGTPRTLLEAAAMAKPLIATRVPGCVEIVDHEVNGYLCEVKNAASLAEQMLRMYLLENAKLQKMGLASRQKVEEKFDEKLVIRKYMDALQDC
ncbi:glycosyltransferase family 4 protein [Rhodocytophaga aerolata]|uniref:Glycosyltransferase family 4 protein n=1 Tax=Rhodocytophaga aerolata TaxID=455078 RepID=A0ABT8R0E3_9BACT|nr:glycosyltransferase family 4 protein [Rhodocytophaga aerolata]MDO1445551.1 glycosyltransferase family 4 protein [Rhodocytophaga aerolata]